MQITSFLLFWVHLSLFFNFNLPSLSSPFLPSDNVTLYGDAHFRDNVISLTQEHGCPPSSSPSSGVGRALYAYPIRFLDPTTNTTASFFCSFSFSIIPSPLCPFGDGIAFLITSSPDSFSLSNGYIGLPGPALDPQDSFIAIEFDTSSDSSLGDINDNHIGVDVNTVVSFASEDTVSKGIDLKSGRQISAWIEYIESAKTIQVWASYSNIRPSYPVLAAQVDLSEHFKEYMHIGFSASNGKGSAVHLVDHWRFRTYGSLPPVSPVGVIEEGECFMCRPKDPSNYGSNDNFHERRKKMKELALGFGGLAAFFTSMIAVIAIIIFFMVRRKMDVKRTSKESQVCRGDRVPTRLSIAEIKSATMGFHHDRVLGHGASATVYKGCLPSGEAVAIKRFDLAAIDTMQNPFITEFATMVGCIRHKNLVQLKGWCCEGTELVLVFEYMPNGSLDQVLHKKTDSAIVLSWKQRLNIVLGVASALSYLHNECERQIIHRDVKTRNIMLDGEFNAKLGDFGLAEVYEHSARTRQATLPAGTMGYLAPEYVYAGVPTEKSDVYSFGVVVLEVATAKKPVDDDGTVLVDWVWGFWEKGKLIEAVDPKLGENLYNGEMDRMLMVGLSCVHPNHEMRPTVKEAAMILRGEAPLPSLPARKPLLGFQCVFSEDSVGPVNVGADQSPCTTEAWMTPKSHFG